MIATPVTRIMIRLLLLLVVVVVVVCAAVELNILDPCAGWVILLGYTSSEVDVLEVAHHIWDRTNGQCRLLLLLLLLLLLWLT